MSSRTSWGPSKANSSFGAMSTVVCASVFTYVYSKWTSYVGVRWSMYCMSVRLSLVGSSWAVDVPAWTPGVTTYQTEWQVASVIGSLDKSKLTTRFGD